MATGNIKLELTPRQYSKFMTLLAEDLYEDEKYRDPEYISREDYQEDVNLLEQMDRTYELYETDPPPGVGR